jgi:hypothetical protein
MASKSMDVFSLVGFRGFIGMGRSEFEWVSLSRKHQPLTVTAVTFQTEKSQDPLVLLAADLPLLSPEGEGFIVSSLAGALGIPVQNFLLNVSYASLATDSSGASSGMPSTSEEVIAPFLEAIEKAQANIRIATLEVTSTPCSMAFGETRPWENILTIGRIVDGMGQIQGTLVNYSCLPGKTDLPSPGFIGQMRRVVETLVNGKCVYLQGPTRSAYPRLATLGERLSIDRFGIAMGHTVYANLMGLFPPVDTMHDYPDTIEMRSRLVGWQVGNIPFYTLSEPSNFTTTPLIALGKAGDEASVQVAPAKIAVAA